ncbi:MAG: hypothetical protein Q9163_001813 [Psora crenata]
MHPAVALVLLLPALASAQAQKPMADRAKGWFNAAKQYLPTAIPTVPGITVSSIPEAAKSPVSASASKIAALKVHPITMSNYEALLTPEPGNKGPTEWMIFVTGGNKTCGGHCHDLEVAWNKTSSIMAADPQAPNLGVINCDKEAVLCAAWTAKPPTIWHIKRPVPGPDQSMPATTDIHINYLNFTTTTAQDMVALHTGKKYEDGYLYEGVFHPFDGWLAQYGLQKVVGYILFGFGLIPSWAFMLVVSMASRAAM